MQLRPGAGDTPPSVFASVLTLVHALNREGGAMREVEGGGGCLGQAVYCGGEIQSILQAPPPLQFIYFFAFLPSQLDTIKTSEQPEKIK